MRRRREPVAVALALVALVATGCGSSAEPGRGPAMGEAHSAVTGAALFAEHCGTCHRPGGTGADLVALDPDPVLVEDAVRVGRFESGMPAYETTLDDDEIDAIVDYVVTYRR
ncbi:c-type cytochrome [Rhabdothermincola salaria]|uniref:c-type cytochrome n=1 Tax=Rhabdothermincola salaria TaxID=2903142 RepID=UPI001E3C4BFB|nr:cytochrome c [Rhabdothermincola salaria]MCD9622945.1 cytochrome c [Rhabdothermincola salaria]